MTKLALFRLGFPSASYLLVLNLATPSNSPDRSTKSTRLHSYGASTACKHRVSGSFSLPSRGSFHLSFTVLCAIGHRGVFRLGGWSLRLPTRFLVSRGTLDPARLRLDFVYGIFTLYDAIFQNASTILTLATTQSATPKCKHSGLACFPFARRYLGNRCFFLLLKVLRCFSSLRSLCMVMYWPYSNRGLLC